MGPGTELTAGDGSWLWYLTTAYAWIPDTEREAAQQGEAAQECSALITPHESPFHSPFPASG